MRYDDWQSRLADWLAAEVLQPFNEADRHCGWFVADAILVMTGHDYVAEWRGRHKTMAGAMRALKRAGFADHIALVSDLLPETAPAFAHIGDVMVMPVDGDLALGILQGEYVYLRGRDGIVMMNRMSAVRAFTVF